jgi:hypothetical protein
MKLLKTEKGKQDFSSLSAFGIGSESSLREAPSICCPAFTQPNEHCTVKGA